MYATIAHALIVLGILGAYVAVTLTGHDGNDLLALLGGYGAGVGIHASATTSPSPL